MVVGEPVRFGERGREGAQRSTSGSSRAGGSRLVGGKPGAAVGASAAYGCADGCVVCGFVEGFFVAVGFRFEVEDYFFHRAGERVGTLVAVFGIDGHAVVAADVHACVEGETE